MTELKLSNPTEIWRQSKHRNYEVSNLGNVRNKKNGRVLKHYPNSTGYRMIYLSDGGYVQGHLVHRLVALAFKKKEPIFFNQRTVVHHINRDRTDNRTVNLKFISDLKNNSYINRKGIANSSAKLNNKDIIAIRALYKTGRMGYGRICKIFPVTRVTLSKIIKGKLWTHL